MLTHVSDEELNDVPRVGPLRRKMLKDVIDFVERIPPRSTVSTQSRNQIAEIWGRIARLSWDLDEYEQARQSGETAISMRTQLVTDVTNNWGIRKRLAETQDWQGRLNLWRFHDYRKAEEHFRNSEQLLAQLVKDRPGETNWMLAQVATLLHLSEALAEQGKKEEAIGCLARALDLLDRCNGKNSLEHAWTLRSLGDLHRSDPNPAESDEFYRQSFDILRPICTGEKASRQERANFARVLWAAAKRTDFATRKPREAEQMLDESIAIFREIYGKNPSRREQAIEVIRSLQAQAEHLRRHSSDQGSTQSSDGVEPAAVRASALMQEALVRKRDAVDRFALPEDRFGFTAMLHEEAEFLLNQVAKANLARAEDAIAYKLRADALLTEAIQLCRALAAEFPDNAEYQSRLAALEKLQAQHLNKTVEQGKAGEGK